MKKKKRHLLLSPNRLKRILMAILFTLIASITLWIQDQHEAVRPVVAGSSIELYANQIEDTLTETFSQAIGDAQKSILLVIYSLTDPDIIHALNQQSKKGISVKVVCDAKASPYINSKLHGDIEPIRRFGPGLMHQKILVVDNEKTWIGSANMTTESLRMHGNLVAGLSSEVIAEYILKKAATLGIEGKGPSFPPLDTFIGGQPVELWFLPDNKHAVQRLDSLIKSAKKTIRIAMFTWTRQDLAKAVIQAAERGIDTEVVIDKSSGQGASAKIVRLLKKNGISVNLSIGAPLLHHKFLYIDGETLVNGSANWTKAAFTQNDDCFLIIHNLTHEQRDRMEALWRVIREESRSP